MLLDVTAISLTHILLPLFLHRLRLGARPGT